MMMAASVGNVNVVSRCCWSRRLHAPLDEPLTQSRRQNLCIIVVEAFAKSLPPGAMNFVSGRGRDTMPHLMKTGDIDALAFIGGSKAADDLIGQHPHPHRLKVFLQLEAKNMAVRTDRCLWSWANILASAFAIPHSCRLAHWFLPIYENDF